MSNIVQDIGNGLGMGKNGIFSNIEQTVAPTIRNVEQGLSGGAGWGGLGKNVAAVLAAPATAGGSLVGSQWGENALSGKDILGKQENMIPQDKTMQAYNEVANSLPSGDVPQGATPAPGMSTNPVGPQPQKDLLGSIMDSTKPGGLVSQIEQGISGGKGVGGALEGAGNVMGSIMPTVENYLGSQATADVARRGQDLQAKAYQEMAGRAKEGEGQFLGALNEPNQALGAYQKDIQDLGQQAIGRQQNIINQQLGRAGVKGGQAANLYGRQIGELQQGGMRDVNKLAYEDAQNRANQKSQYFANKGQSGFNLVPKYI